MTNSPKPILLQNFSEALKNSPEATDQLGRNTVWRYRQGDVPKCLRWLHENPKLARAFLADAEAAQSSKQSQMQEAA